MANSPTSFEIDKDKLVLKMSRVFDASRERLWRAHTSAAEMAKWWGPGRYRTTIEKLEVRAGGEWRMLHENDEGERHAFHGVYKEVVEPDHITWTFVYEGIPDADSHAITETVTFTDLGGGRTRLDTVSHYLAREDLDGMVASGMEEGARESWDRLAELVEKGA